MSKEDIYRRRLEGERMHWWNTDQLLRATIDRNLDDIVESMFYVRKASGVRPATDHRGRPMTYWGGMQEIG